MRGLCAAVLGCLALAACGGGGGGSSSSLEVQPRSASTQASGATITFTSVVKGDSGMPIWTLGGSAPDLGTVVPVQGSSTLYTPPVKVDAAITVTLTATLNELTSTATITVSPAPAVTVAGRVVQNTRLGVANATVQIPGSPVVTTDAAGAFEIAGVTPPYDLYVRSDNYVVAYEGLRRLDPTAFIEVNGTMEPPFHAAVTGQVSGAAAGHRVVVGFGSTDVADFYADAENVPTWALADANGAYGFSVPLTAPETTGTLYALEYQEDGSGTAEPNGLHFPTAYARFATLPNVHLASGSTTSGQHLTLGTALGTSHVTGALSYGGAAAYLDVDARFGYAWLPVGTVLMTGTSFSVPTPSTAEEVRVSLHTGSPDGRYLEDWRSALAPNASGVSLSFDEGFPNPTSPPEGAVVTRPDTQFVWQLMGTPDVTYIVKWNGPVVMTLVTAARPVVTIPDLSALGVSVPSGAAFRWWVTGTTASSQVDDLAGPQTYEMRTSHCYWARSLDLGFHVP